MQLNRIKIWIVVAVLFFLGCLFFVYQNWPDQSIHLAFCDVGQGDAILIHHGFFQVLIDSSQDDRVLSCLSRFLPKWDRELEVVIITHYHQDHIGGLASILNIYRVKTLLAADPPPGFTEKNPELMASLTAEAQTGMIWKKPFFGQIMNLASETRLDQLPVTLEVLQALPGGSQAKEGWSENDRSIVTLLKAGMFTALFTGDLETAGERLLLASGHVSPVTLLKVGHHGSKTSTTPEFLEKIHPEVAVISVGKNNSYGHPGAVTLANLAEHGVKVLTTAKLGTIEIITDGKTYWQR